jgi:hypothetical protein
MDGGQRSHEMHRSERDRSVAVMISMRRFLILPFLVFLTTGLRAQQPPGLRAAVQDYAVKSGEHEIPTFRYALTDLDGDGRVDAVVLLSGSSWCGSGGCNMLVFRGRRDGFTFVSGSTLANPPIRVSPEKAHGWRTLIVYSKGKGDVLMRFDGKRYPLNPSLQPKTTHIQLSAAQVVMN